MLSLSRSACIQGMKMKQYVPCLVMEVREKMGNTYGNPGVEGFQGSVHEFSPTRARDILDRSVDQEAHNSRKNSSVQGVQGPIETEYAAEERRKIDDVVTYNHTANVSLSSVMQSNVPEPYSNQSMSPGPQNMPMGGVMRNQKYVAGELTDNHPSRNYTTSSQHDQGKVSWMESFISGRKSAGDGCQSICDFNLAAKSLLHQHCVAIVPRCTGNAILSNPPLAYFSVKSYSTDANDETAETNLSQKERLKRAVKEYGGTVVVFHVCISLISLGGFYLAVSSGIDVLALLQKMGVGEAILESRLAQGTSTFLLAYAVHKVFAPVRIAITLTSTPFIVRYLRRVGVLKPPKPKSA